MERWGGHEIILLGALINQIYQKTDKRIGNNVLPAALDTCIFALASFKVFAYIYGLHFSLERSGLA
jgi:hypothetical protein